MSRLILLQEEEKEIPREGERGEKGRGVKERGRRGKKKKRRRRGEAGNELVRMDMLIEVEFRFVWPLSS